MKVLLLLTALLLLPFAAFATPPIDYAPYGSDVSTWDSNTEADFVEFAVILPDGYFLDVHPVIVNIDFNTDLPAVPFTRDPAIKGDTCSIHRQTFQRFVYIETIEPSNLIASRESLYRARDAL
jgi:hypothetical protein